MGGLWGRALPWLQLPPWHRCFTASPSGVGIFFFHTPDTFILFFFAQNVSTKGKIFNTPWDHARPGRGQRGALACWLPATPEKSSHLAAVLSWQGAATSPPGVPCPAHPACRRSRVSGCAAHTCQGRVPSCCSAGSPCACPHVLQLLGTVHSPVPGLPGGSFWAEGQQERPLHIFGLSMLYLQLSVGIRGLCLFFEGWGVRPKLVLVALGQFAIVCVLFSGGNATKPPWGSPGLLSLEWGLQCLSSHPPAPTFTPNPLGQRQPLTPDLLSFLHKRQVSEVAQGVGLGAAASSSSLAGSSCLLRPCLTLSTGLGTVTQS